MNPTGKGSATNAYIYLFGNMLLYLQRATAKPVDVSKQWFGNISKLINLVAVRLVSRW